MNVVVANAQTGERIERDPTEQEISDQQAWEAERVASEADALAARQAALAKLAALGLTVDDLTALGL